MRGFIIGLSVTVSLLVPVYFVAAGLGSKFGLWPWQFGLGTMVAQWGLWVCVAAAGLAVIALGFALFAPGTGGRVGPVVLTLVALLIPALAVGRLAGFRTTVGELPPIHDTQTDWTAPIAFSDALMALRGPDANPVLADPTVPEAAAGRWPLAAGKRVAAIQEERYADIRPILVQAPVDVAIAAVELALDQAGGTLLLTPPAPAPGGEAREASFTSFWFGFTDDVHVRVLPQGEGARIDIRSVSRVGLSDIGANAVRVKTLARNIQQQLRAAGEEPELAPPAAPAAQ
jgi:fatty-acyl-CoA synthase